MFKSIQSKFILWAGLALIVTAGVVILMAAVMLRGTAVEAAKNAATETARNQANSIEREIGDAFDVSRTVAEMLSAAKSQNASLTREQVSAMLHETLLHHPDLIGIWTIWDVNAFDGKDAEYVNTTGHDATGRFMVYWSRDPQGNVTREIVYENPDTSIWYLSPKESLTETILEPYVYTVQGVDTLLTSLVVPIVVNNKFYGVTAVDFSLNHFQNRIDTLESDYGGQEKIALVTYNGSLMAVNGRPELVGKPLSDYHADSSTEDLSIIQSGQESSRDVANEISVYAPVQA